MVDTTLAQPAVETNVRRGGRNNGTAFGRIMMYVVLIFFAIIAIFPFFWMISNSLMTVGETQVRKILPAVPQFENYAIAWEQAEFSKYFINSCVIVGVTIAGVLIVTVLAAYAFA